MNSDGQILFFLQSINTSTIVIPKGLLLKGNGA